MVWGLPTVFLTRKEQKMKVTNLFVWSCLLAFVLPVGEAKAFGSLVLRHLSHLPAGLYFLHISIGNERKVLKLIVK